jgi:hypothetical protein
MQIRTTIMTKRSLVFITCTIASAFGIYLATKFAIEAIAGIFKTDSTPLQFAMLFAAGIVILYSWLSYFAMAWYWIKNIEAPYHWVKYGTICGGACAVFFNIWSLLVLPAVVLAFYMAIFHSPYNPQNKV